MKVNGSVTLPATAGQVWAALTDPAVLGGAIPGCDDFQPGDGTARLTVTAAVASTRAAYTVAARVRESQRPDALTLAIEASGAPGTLTGTGQVRLTPAGAGTVLSYEAQAEASGQLAGVGQSLLSATVTRLAARLFEGLAAALQQDQAAARGVTQSGAPATGAPPAPPPPAVPPAPPRVSPLRAAPPPAEPATPRTAAAPAATAAPHTRPRPGKGFGPGVLVGAAIGVAAAKLGSLIAGRNR
jgi:hypothetical protein